MGGLFSLYFTCDGAREMILTVDGQLSYQFYALQTAGQRCILPKVRVNSLQICEEIMQNPTDEEIKEILKSAKNIAVVGLSDKPGFILAGVGQGGIAIA